MYVICKKRTCTYHSIISRQFSIPTGRQTELFIDIWYHVANALKNQFPDGLANGIIKQMALTNIGRSRGLRFISVEVWKKYWFAIFFWCFLISNWNFLLFLHMVSLIVTTWKVFHPSDNPYSKGSIEVHAELKHATVTRQMLQRVLGGRLRHIEKAFTWRLSLTSRNLANFKSCQSKQR